MSAPAVVVTAPAPPEWALRLVGRTTDDGLANEPARGVWRTGEIVTGVVETGAVSLISVTIADAVELDAAGLRGTVCSAYREILRRIGDRHAVRYWNFIPRIHDRMIDEDRYMVFNAGRFEALATQEGSGAAPPVFPTASGVGYKGEDLVIHCLTAHSPGEPVENPRQVPAYRYSARYGPRPPCFSRATSACLAPGDGRSLLIAGTASVVGEDSLHPDDLRRQLAETFTNLEALLEAWSGRERRGGAGSRSGRFTSLRIYHVFESHRDAIVDAVRSRFPLAGRVETVVADICRPELLVEIEGVAREADRRREHQAE